MIGGTFAAEKALYASWGWDVAASVDREPDLPTISMVGADPPIHDDDTENDDVWMNLIQLDRGTPCPNFLQRATAWVNDYYLVASPLYRERAQYLNDGTAYGRCHLYGEGLLSWWERYGDVRARDLAILLGADSIAIHGVQTPTQMWRGGGRGLARNLMLAMELDRLSPATAPPPWTWKTYAEHLVDLAAWSWNPTWGTWAGDFSYGFRTHSCWHVSLLHRSLAEFNARYPTNSRFATVDDYLRKHAAFGLRNAQHPIWLHSGIRIRLDSPPSTVVHMNQNGTLWTDSVEPSTSAAYTSIWADVLVRGFNYTGDINYLKKAASLWAVASKHASIGPATYRKYPATQTGEYMGSVKGTSPRDFKAHGNLIDMTLFVDALTANPVPSPDGGPPPPPPPPPSAAWYDAIGDDSWLEPAMPPHDHWQPKACQECGDPPGYTIDSWHWKALAVTSPVYRNESGLTRIPGGAAWMGGAHISHPGNDIAILNAANPTAPEWFPDPVHPDVISYPHTYWQSVDLGTGRSAITPTDGEPGVVQPGRPWVGHTNQEVQYWPRTNSLFLAMGSGSYLYGLAENTWSRLCDGGAAAGVQWLGTGGCVFLDTKRDRMLNIVKAPQSATPGVYVWNDSLTPPKWTLLYAATPAFARGRLYGVYDEARDKFYALNYDIDVKELWELSVDTGVWRALTVPATPFLNDRYPGIGLDTRHNVLVLLYSPDPGPPVRSGTVFVATPTSGTWTWTQQPSALTIPTGKHGAWNALQYVPEIGAFVYLFAHSLYCPGQGGTAWACGGATRTFFYRYRTAHPAVKVTRLAPCGLPGRRYGSFVGKRQYRAALTQLAPSGIPGKRYRS